MKFQKSYLLLIIFIIITKKPPKQNQPPLQQKTTVPKITTTAQEFTPKIKISKMLRTNAVNTFASYQITYKPPNQHKPQQQL